MNSTPSRTILAQVGWYHLANKMFIHTDSYWQGSNLPVAPSDDWEPVYALRTLPERDSEGKPWQMHGGMITLDKAWTDLLARDRE